MDTLTPGRDAAPVDGRPVRMDPRIRQRRIQVRRAEGRRRLKLLIALVTVASIVAAAVAATHSALLDVDHVHVRGAHAIAGEDVLRAAGLDRHRFLIDVAPAAVAHRVEALPRVDRAKVERHWPGTVTITVTERTPIAVLPAGAGAVALIDATGRVVDQVAAPPAGLLHVDGADPAPAPGQKVSGRAGDAVAVAAALPADVRGKVATIDVTAGDDVDLHLAPSNAVVRIGGTDDLGAKMVALATLMTRVDMGDLATMDLRVPDAPVLTRKSNGA